MTRILIRLCSKSSFASLYTIHSNCENIQRHQQRIHFALCILCSVDNDVSHSTTKNSHQLDNFNFTSLSFCQFPSSTLIRFEWKDHSTEDSRAARVTSQEREKLAPEKKDGFNGRFHFVSLLFFSISVKLEIPFTQYTCSNATNVLVADSLSWLTRD